MFDKFKKAQNLLRLRNDAKKLQAELEQIKHTESDGEFSVSVSGSQTVLSLKVNGEEQKRLVDLLNRAFKEVQKKSAKRIMELGGGLGGLLGGLGG
jgi:DNA-binding protein YbaB